MPNKVELNFWHAVCACVLAFGSDHWALDRAVDGFHFLPEHWHDVKRYVWCSMFIRYTFMSIISLCAFFDVQNIFRGRRTSLIFALPLSMDWIPLQGTLATVACAYESVDIMSCTFSPPRMPQKCSRNRKMQPPHKKPTGPSLLLVDCVRWDDARINSNESHLCIRAFPV